MACVKAAKPGGLTQLERDQVIKHENKCDETTLILSHLDFVLQILFRMKEIPHTCSHITDNIKT